MALIAPILLKTLCLKDYIASRKRIETNALTKLVHGYNAKSEGCFYQINTCRLDNDV